MSVVPGDPASMSACGGTVRRVASDLAGHADGIRHSTDALGEGWGGRTSARARRGGDAVASATASTAEQLDHVGRVLQDHATDLADLVARGRRIAERAAESGLEVREGRVDLAFGVTGTADLEATRAADRERQSLQRDLDLVCAQHRRRRDWVLEVLRGSSESLSEASRSLRQG